MMIAKRTKAMEDLYKEDHEIVFFNDLDELKSKALMYSRDTKKCIAIGQNGLKRARDSGYDVGSRARQILDGVQNLQR